MIFYPGISGCASVFAIKTCKHAPYSIDLAQVDFMWLLKLKIMLET